MRRRSVVVLSLLVLIAAIMFRSPRSADDAVLPTLVELPTLTPLASVTPMTTAPFTPEFGLTMDIASRLVYAQGDVVLRLCPSRDCADVGRLPDGGALMIDGIINGEAVSAGNAIWYRGLSAAGTVYVYSEVVTDRATASAPISTVASPYTCNQMDDLNCEDFRAGGAQAHLDMCGDEDLLDADLDGAACE